ncbi:MAG: hypothetical protein K6F47_10675 [Bacteroidaceae bacterium]|nr:hypothetical protein [Bacteroidaceae bacterium]
MNAISDYFMMGGPWFMAFLTLLLALVFLAAWKAPAWVHSIGLIALACGFLFSVLGLYQMYDYMQAHGEIGLAVVYGGYKCGLVPVSYGTIIFIISQIIYLFQKPRI